MRQLTAVLVLVLASVNASKYFRQETQLQQEPPWREKFQEVPYLAIAFDDDRLLPKLSSGEESRWEPPQDPRLVLLGELESLENLLQDDGSESRTKRTKPSLSIDNPLDVLREQYFRALARRMKYKSIEKNREHLLKTGKRSGKDGPYPVKRSEFPPGAPPKEAQDGGPRGARQDPAPRRYRPHLDDLSFQT